MDIPENILLCACRPELPSGIAVVDVVNTNGLRIIPENRNPQLLTTASPFGLAVVFLRI